MIWRYLLFLIQNLLDNKTCIYLTFSCLLLYHVLSWRQNICDSSSGLENYTWLFQYKFHFHLLRDSMNINCTLIQTPLEERRKIEREIWGRYLWFIDLSIMEICSNFLRNGLGIKSFLDDCFLVHLETGCLRILQV